MFESNLNEITNIFFASFKAYVTENGKQIFYNFLSNICGITQKKSPEYRKESCIRNIREVVGNKKVLILVSGGIDSAICATLLTKALSPEQVYALHIDTGEFVQRILQT